MYIRIISGLLLVLSSTTTLAQSQVFPGDANANGRIDHYDILSIGYAYGQFGPARIQANDDATLQGIPQEWNATFPNGSNYVHADANGNGLVEFTDFFTVHNNFGQELPIVTPLDFPESIPIGSPSMMVNQGFNIDPVSQDAIISFPISIEASALNQDINGIAFDIEFEETHFAEFSFEFADDWLTENGQAFEYKRSGAGKISLAITRFGDNPVDGGGDIGVLSLIIIDDLITLLEAPDDTLYSKIKITNILATGNEYVPVAVAKDSLELRLYHHDITAVLPSIHNDLEAIVFPNPSKGDVSLNSTYSFHTLQCISSNGQITALATNHTATFWNGKIDLPPGQYWLRVVGIKGESLLPLILSP